MDYFLPYFGKSFENLEIEDIVSYFKDEHTESNRIEFKSYNPEGNFNDLIKKVIESICAFLNSEGGIIIWGAPLGKQILNKKEKIFSGAPTFIDIKLEHDKLINIVSDKITPLPSGISARVIGENNKFLYLFNIQASIIKPHQYDNKYMIRLDGQSRIAPHYYIEAMFRQIKYPEIEGFIKFGAVTVDFTTAVFDIESVIFNWSPFQNEKNINILIFSPQGIFKYYNPRALQVHNKFQNYDMNGHQSLIRYTEDILFYGNPFLDSDKLVVELTDVTKGKEVQLILRFGGENSPQKESFYKFNFNMVGNKPFVNITEKIENKLISDIRAETGQNKNEVIKKFVGR